MSKLRIAKGEKEIGEMSEEHVRRIVKNLSMAVKVAQLEEDLEIMSDILDSTEHENKQLKQTINNLTYLVKDKIN